MDGELQLTREYELWQAYESLKSAWNFDKYVEEAQAFYNGDQYASPNYKNMPRLVMNIISFAENIKASKVVGTPRYYQFTSSKQNVDCLKLQRFDEYNQSKLNEKTEDFQSALNGFNNGTEIVLYRWDEDDTAYKGIYKGGLSLEHIDPRNFAVDNPSLSEIQNQKWIMYCSDEDLSVVRRLCEGDEEMKNRIIPDDLQQGEDIARSNTRSVRVYTRMFKIGGEVFFVCATKEVPLFRHPHALSPRVNEILGRKLQESYEGKLKGEIDDSYENIPDFDIDGEDAMIPYVEKHLLSDEAYIAEKEKFSLYPVAVFVPFAINGKWFGRSDAKTMIPTQKGINFMLSMMLMCAQNNAYNKIFAKEGALMGQEITNEPGQVIVDHTKMANGWGIKMAESQPMPNGVIDFVSRLFDMTRVVGGFNDVMDGSISNQDISGWAIQQMIKQANTSIEQQQQIFWKFCKDKAAIRLMFYKFFVDQATFTYDLEDFEVQKQEDARMRLKGVQQARQRNGESLEVGDVDLSVPTKKTRVEEISKDEIYGIDFDIAIDVLQGTNDSKLAESQMWDNLIAHGGIKNMDTEMLELYLEANPVITYRTKQILRSIVERQKTSENHQLKAALEQATAKLQQCAAIIQQQGQQLAFFNEYNKNLTREFGAKINAANKTIQGQNDALAKMRGGQPKQPVAITPDALGGNGGSNPPIQ